MRCHYYTDANPKMCVLQVEEPCEECGRYEKEGDGVKREEILAMKPGLKLGVALVLHVFENDLELESDDLRCLDETGPGAEVQRKMLRRMVRRYSENIADAWSIVEDMRERPGVRGCKACIEVHGTDDEDEPYWALVHGHEASGKTAPEAIAKAALVAVMGSDA